MKTALITGSTQGIGKQIGIDLLDGSYFVYFNGHTQESTRQLEQEIGLRSYDNDYLPDFNILCQDLSTLEGNLELANYLKANDRYLDTLILNLGITNRTKFGAICYDSWKKVIDVNLNFPFFLIQSLNSHIKENGRIIFISSISGIIPDSTSISYGVSKAGLNMLVLYLAKEFANRKITVNAIAPGFTNSNWHKGKSKAQIKRIQNKILLKRFADQREISSLVLEVINNPYINGQILRCDGGFGLI